MESDLKIKSLLALCAVADIAVLETDLEAPFHLSFRSEPLSEDEDLAILGYPDYPRAFHAIRKTGPLTVFFKGWQEFPVEKEGSTKGASGGPVIDSRGQVVGIYKRGNNDSAIFTGGNQLKAVLEGRDRSSLREGLSGKMFKKSCESGKAQGICWRR